MYYDNGEEQMKFEWDENKYKANLVKHSIDFKRAIYIFDDPNRIEKIDNRCDYGETRYQVLGKIQDEIILFVIATNRPGKIRIISARRANKKEKGEYNGNS
jgi:uncharacterized DUF497 family protein